MSQKITDMDKRNNSVNPRHHVATTWPSHLFTHRFCLHSRSSAACASCRLPQTSNLPARNLKMMGKRVSYCLKPQWIWTKGQLSQCKTPSGNQVVRVTVPPIDFAYSASISSHRASPDTRTRTGPQFYCPGTRTALCGAYNYAPSPIST